MANPITINREPNVISPVYNDLTFEVISTNNTQPQMKYIFELHRVDGVLDTVINTSKLYPDPFGFARYNPSKILQSYLYTTNMNEISSKSYGYANELIEYYIIFKEEYIYNNILTTYIRLTSDFKYCWMSSADWEEGKYLITYTNQFIANSANTLSTNAAEFLGVKKYVQTTGPDSLNAYKIRKDEKRILSLLTKDMVTSYRPTYLNVVTKPLNGFSIKTFRYNFSVSNLTYPEYLMIHQPIGIAELNNITWTSISPTGSTINYLEDESYMIWFSTNTITNITHKPINMYIDNCLRFDKYTVMYKSNEGAWWYIPMNLKSYKNENIENSTMDTFLPYNYSNNSSQTKVITLNARGEIILNSDWMKLQTEIDEYMDMLKSPVIYLIDKNNKYIPVIIKSGSFNKPNINQDGLVQFTISFTEAYNKNTTI